MMKKSDIFENFPDYVPQEVCLSCQGCCRFDAEKSLWRPKISKAEMDEANEEYGGIKKIYSSATVDQNHFLKAYEIPKSPLHSAVCQCTFFDIEKNICTIYKKRPFDCKLYPFLFVKKGEVYFVAVHLNCPFIERTRHSQDFQNHVNKVRSFFAQNQVLEYFRQNSYLAGEFGEFQHEIEYLFKLEIT